MGTEGGGIRAGRPVSDGREALTLGQPADVLTTLRVSKEEFTWELRMLAVLERYQSRVGPGPPARHRALNLTRPPGCGTVDSFPATTSGKDWTASIRRFARGSDARRRQGYARAIQPTPGHSRGN